MKMKKITALIVSAVALFASFSALPAASLKANAEEAKVQLVHAYDEYSNSFITEKFQDAYGITFEDGKDYFFEYKNATAEEYGKGVDADSGKTTFEIAPGAALMRFYSETAGAEGEEATKEYVEIDGVSEFAFDVISETKEGSVRYYTTSLTKEAIANYNASIETKYETKKIGDNFYYPSMEDVVIVNDNKETEEVNEEVKANLFGSDHYDYADLTKELWYCRPGSTSFSKTTSSSFNLNAVGNYSFYVLAYDAHKTYIELDTEVHTRKVVDGIEGWYDDTDNLIVPIFSFYFAEVKEIAITVSESEIGFKGLTYKDVDDSIKIVGENEGSKYELYYSATLLEGSDGSDEEWTSKGVSIIEGSSSVKNITEEEDYAFNASNRHFVPQELGYYYVVCRAADQTGTAEAVTYAIVVNSEFKAVKYETQFFKQNLFSIICLAIAFVLLIAIIVVFFFYKPAEEKAEESVDPVSKK